MEYIDAATSGTLSPHVLPVIDLQRMLQHIADTLPPTLHLPISSDYSTLLEIPAYSHLNQEQTVFAIN